MESALISVVAVLTIHILNQYINILIKQYMIHIQIRHFPLARSSQIQTYNVIYGPNGTIINTPICNLNCKSTCYTDLSQINTDMKACPKCLTPFKTDSNFIDTGLQYLIAQNRTEIYEKGYIAVQLNHETNEIVKWIVRSSTSLMHSISQFLATDFENEIKKQKIGIINYYAARTVIADEFEKLYGEINTKKRILWCRKATSMSGEYFSHLVVLNQSRLMIAQLRQDNGSIFKFKDKHTHITLLKGTLIIIENDEGTGRIIIHWTILEVKAWLIVKSIPQNSFKLMNRKWFSIATDFKNNDIYLIGGVGTSHKEDVKEIEKIKIIFKDQILVGVDCTSNRLINTPRRNPAATIGYFGELPQKKRPELIIFSGVSNKEPRLIKTFTTGKLSDRQLDSYCDPYQQQQSVNSYLIQIPSTNRVMIFGGTKDWQYDSPQERRTQRWVRILNEQQILQQYDFPDSANLLYSNDNSAVFCLDKNDRPYIQILIPCRYNETAKVVGYLMTYWTKEKKFEYKEVKQPILKK